MINLVSACCDKLFPKYVSCKGKGVPQDQWYKDFKTYCKFPKLDKPTLDKPKLDKAQPVSVLKVKPWNVVMKGKSTF